MKMAHLKMAGSKIFTKIVLNIIKLQKVVADHCGKNGHCP